MKPTIAVCFLCAAVLAPAGAMAQRPSDRAQPFRKAASEEGRAPSISFHNPYTGANVNAGLLLPNQARPLAAIVLVSGGSRREQQGAGLLAHYLVEHGYAVMGLEPIAATGATEEDSLNAIAALHYLETKPELKGTRVGLAGYGEGVRLAATAASQGNPAAFLILLGGAVVPDKLNALPDHMTPAALPKTDAVHALSRVTCPVLILLGEYDRQGTHRNAASNAEGLRAALEAGKHRNYTIKVMMDSDDLLAETRAGSGDASTAVPPASVWKNVTDWTARQLKVLDPNAGSDDVEGGPNKPIRIYPKSVYGPFSFRPEMVWAPAIGGQTRPYGFWYW
ncbi:MAG TPA: hypothetical protein VKT77_09560 [Chthonomonadaceae bacterium]|nr:hypothetical protein [Chthonomonadaceae bacterium]